MKFVFAFLTLLHFHQVHCSYMNGITAIISRLRELNKDSQINSTLVKFEMPSSTMKLSATCCLPEFKTNLLTALNFTTDPEKHQDSISGIIDTLDQLLSPENGIKEKCIKRCTWKCDWPPEKPFDKYIHFLTKLNRKQGERKRRSPPKMKYI